MQAVNQAWPQRNIPHVTPQLDFWNNQVSANPYKLPGPEQPSTETETGPGYLTPELDIGQPFSREDNGMK